MRGFVISISALLLFSVIVSFVFFLYYENSVLENRLSTRGAPPSFVFDDIAADLNAISNLNISANRSNATLSVQAQGAFSNAPNASTYSSYAHFLSTNYSNLTNSNLSLDASGLSDGSAEALFSNGLAFSYAYAGASKSSVFSTSSSDTDASAYEVNVSVDRQRNNYIPWSSSPNGNLNVTLRITDRSGTISSIVTLNRSSANSFIVMYQGGQLAVRAGKIGAADGALQINPSGTIVDCTSYSANAFFPPGNLSSSIRYYWNAWLSYSIPGNLSKSDWVEIGRT